MPDLVFSTDCFFFFKQKTAYELRISDWSSDVCSSDLADAATYHLNPFDLTKVWPHQDYPLIEVGVMELNRNPENVFAEVEQAAFSPANIVPGIGFSPDKMLQARRQRSEEHTSELQSLMRISYAVFCLKKKKQQ